MKYVIDEKTLTSIADACREAARVSSKLTPNRIAQNIPTRKAEENGFGESVSTWDYIFTVYGEVFKDIFQTLKEYGYDASETNFVSEIPDAIVEVCNLANENGYAEGVVDGEQIGQKAEYDKFWDAYQQNGKRNNYSTAFFQYWWTDDIYNPKYDMVIAAGASSMYQAASQITNTRVKITLDCASTNMFFGCGSLKTVPYLKLTEKATLPNAFRNCKALENITFDGVIKCDVDLQYSTKLTRASIESLMSHLYVGGDAENLGTVTLSLEAVDREFAYTDIDGTEYIGSESPDWLEILPPGVIWDVSLI
jgi:hypothetical protein